MVKKIIAEGEQPGLPGEGFQNNSGSLAALAFGTAGIAATGFIPVGKGRMWDKYLAAIRGMETGSPGAILRTFRTSEFLSPLESWSSIGVAEAELKSPGVYSEYLKGTFGQSAKSIKLKRTGAVFGEIRDETGKLLGMGVQMEAGTLKGSAISDYYARVQGINLSRYDSLNESLLRSKWRASKSPLPYGEWIKTIEPHLRRERLILGAKIRDKITVLGRDLKLSESMARNVAKLETTGNILRAKAASTAGRLNNLLTKPLEIPIVGDIMAKIPGLRSMAVRPGTNLQILGRLTGKGIAAGAAWKGLEYIDYLRSEGSIWAGPLSMLGGAAAGAIIARRPGLKFSKGGLIAGAALGLFSALAPRFDEGLFYGAASTVTDVNLARAKVSSLTGVTESLQEQEAITPGLLGPKAALAFGGIGALAGGFAEYGSFFGKSVMERFGSKEPISRIFEKLRDKEGTLATRLWETSFGKKLAKVPVLKHLTKLKSTAGLGFIAGLAAWQGISSGLSLLAGNPLAAIPGASLLGTTETPEELQDIYSGQKEVAVRKGRWWEFGRSTGYEGGRIDYYRPHFMHRLRTRAYQKGLYGSEEEKWEYDPMMNPLKALFGTDEWKYHYERKHQYDRPAPLTGTYGEDVPFIGPLVAATFGKLFKPRKKVRPEEWNLGGGEYVDITDPRGETEPAYGLGGLHPGAPVAPEEGSQLLNELNYKRREAAGLVGFLEASLTKKAIGREEVFQNLRTLEGMGEETGSEYWLWKHLNLGGGLGTTEAVRRFIPRTPSYLETYNPLKNALPSWMPDEYFLDLKHGNPFKKIAEAELRLPGEGYAALHPELEGVSPEAYPLAHRVKILGDVAMWSDEYKRTLRYAKSRVDQMSPEQAQMVRETEQQVREKKKRREFSEYTFSGDQLEELDVNVSQVLSPRHIKTKEFGDMILEIQGVGAVQNTKEALAFAQQTLEGSKVSVYTPKLESRRYSNISAGPRMKAVPMVGGQPFGELMAEQGFTEARPLEDEFKQLQFSGAEQLAGVLGEKITHGIETPLEYLTPVSPASKLIRKRSAVEEYVATEAIGTGASFWDRPIENFIKPAFNMAKYKAGMVDIPESVQKRRDIQEYFDMLKWVKMSRLEKKARQVGEDTAAAEFSKAKSSTVFGMDVFKSPVNIMRALPRRERDFFGEFSQASTEEERAQILQLIPENERRVYLSQWMRQEERAAYAKKSAKIDTEQDDKIINMTARMRASEGFSYPDGAEEQWLKQTGGRIEFDEWIREKKAGEYFETHSLPGADWLGWHPSVDLEDVKMLMVEQAGLDHHDFDLWGQRRRALSRKPYIEPSLVQAMSEGAEYEDSWKVAENSRNLTGMFNDRQAEVYISQLDADGAENTYNIDVKDGRRDLIERAYRHIGA